jgi:FMN phosphatase YigB (HAD superfamily)
MIKTIIFDLDGVYFTNGTKTAVGKIARKYYVQPDVVEEALVNSKIGLMYRRGELTADDFWDIAKKEMDIPKADSKKLSKLWVESYLPDEEVIKVIKRMKKKKINLFFLSDNSGDRAKYMQKEFRFRKHFIGGVFSHKAHRTKIDGTDLFKLVIKMTGNHKKNILYIDDKKEHAEAARNAGIYAILYENPKQLRKDLRNLKLI